MAMVARDCAQDMPDTGALPQALASEGVRGIGGSDGAVAYAFTERVGGVSRAPYASLNLGAHVGDDPAAVAENRRRALALIGARSLAEDLVVPNQVHGDHVAVIRSADPASLADVRAAVAHGADAVVCTAPEVPVLLCFADCVPVILTCPRGFAVVHSGWKGTIARIAGSAARVLAREASCAPASMRAYIGPHILGDEYEVSPELIARFADAFPGVVDPGKGRLLDLSACIVRALSEAGLDDRAVVDLRLSTMSGTDRFYSYRAEGGVCGRHGALAVLHRMES